MNGGTSGMNAPITVEYLHVDRLGELQSFLDEHWAPGHILARDAELVRWQHRGAGDPDRLSMLVAREGRRIVGALGLILISFCARGRRLEGCWLAAWIATPAARERQAGLRLLRGVLDDDRLRFVGVTGVNERTLGIYRALGFSIRKSVPRWVRIVSEDALTTLLGDAAAGYRVRSPQAFASDRLQISEWSDAHTERWDELWAGKLAPGLLGTWRDAAYLRWRYAEHPRFAYALRVAEEANGTLRGLAVHRIAEVDGASGRVARLVELLGDPEAMTALAHDVVAAAASADAAFVEFYCTAGFVAEPLRAAGFVREAQPAELLPALFEPIDFGTPTLTGAFRVDPTLGIGPAPLDADGFYVTRSDGDQDRPNLPRAQSGPSRA
jgi:hypothetical protein